MKKNTKVLIAIVVIFIIALAGFFIYRAMNKEEEQKSNITITSAQDMENLVNTLYEGLENTLPSLATTVVDVSDLNAVTYSTGLTSNENLEYIVTSEPLMSSQAYSLVLVKVKDGVNANEVAKEMSEKIDTNKWICVSAEKVYATNSGSLVCLVMASEEWAKPVHEKFKSVAGTIGQEYERTQEL